MVWTNETLWHKASYGNKEVNPPTPKKEMAPWARKRARQVKVFATKPDDPSLLPGTQYGGRSKINSHKLVSASICMPSHISSGKMNPH